MLRLLHAQKFLEIYARPSLSFRLVSLLLLFACDFGVATDAGIRIELRLTHQAIAQLIRANRTSVTHFLRDLQQQQLISVLSQSSSRRIIEYKVVLFASKVCYGLLTINYKKKRNIILIQNPIKPQSQMFCVLIFFTVKVLSVLHLFLFFNWSLMSEG